MKAKKFLKTFFYETFRRRSVEDYKNINKPSDTTKFPWLYFRILLIGFILFTVSIILSCILDYGVEEYIYFVAGLFFNIAFIFIPYELDNNKELSISQLIFIIVIALSSVYVPIIVASKIWITENEYLKALRAGTVEELGKAFYAIILVFILQKVCKKKFKLSTILIIGFSVGVGFSIAEDFGYLMFSHWNHLYVAETAINRGISSFHSHMAWTGLITYAFFKFKKPLLNYRFYLVLIGTMFVHTVWDIYEVDFMNQSLYFVFYYFVITNHLIFSILLSLIIILRNNKKIDYLEDQENEEINNIKKESNKFSRFEINRIIILVTIVAVLFFGYQYIYLDDNDEFIKEVDTYEYYCTFEEFKLMKQNGRVFNIVRDREYDYEMLSAYETYEFGVLTSAQQIVEDGDVKYAYGYSLNKETNEFKVNNVIIYIGEDVYYERYLMPMDENDTNDYIYYEIIEFMISENENIDQNSEDVSSIHSSIALIINDFEIDSNQNVYALHCEKEVTFKFYLLIGFASFTFLAGCCVLLIYNVKYNKKRKKEEIE